MNDKEPGWTPSVFKTRKIGLRASLSVKGQIYAQPLYLSDVRVGAQTHNVVFAATMRNNVYAFDVDSYARLWAYNFGCPVPFDTVTLNILSFGSYNIHESIGIQGTPVIDDAGKYIYFVTRIDQKATGTFFGPGCRSLQDGQEHGRHPLCAAQGCCDDNCRRRIRFSSVT